VPEVLADGAKTVGLTVVIEQPRPDTPAPLRAVHQAVAADLRERVRCVGGALEAAGRQASAGAGLRFGPGAGALLTVEGLAGLTAALAQASGTRLDLQLVDFTFVNNAEIPRSAGTCFAPVDGADLPVLALHRDAGPATRAALDGLGLDTSALRAVLPLLGDRDAEIVVAGGMRAHTWRYAEDQVACCVRLMADGGGSEPGRRCSELAGRCAPLACGAGEGARAPGGMLRALYDGVAGEEFVNGLRELGQAVFLDTRAFFGAAVAGRPAPTPEDLYWSDLGEPERVAHAGLRRLTELALGAGYPFILGGPSLLNGGMYALVETAWRVVPDVDLGFEITW